MRRAADTSAAPNDFLSCGDSDAVMVYRPEGVVTRAKFRRDVARLAALLNRRFPQRQHILNVCVDRYRFMVGFAAGLASGRISLLPSSQTPETVRQLRELAPDVFCLHDGDAAIELPQLTYPALDDANDDSTMPFPPMSPDRIAAYVYTSGSTGLPVAHRKTWGALTRNAAAEAAQLKLDAARHHIVATVPPQHMYGFESTILLCLFGHCTFWSGRPFYPADIAHALTQVPPPRMLVTTPFHLRTLLDAGIALPAVGRVLSATAPLPLSLAQRTEQALRAPVEEIYGCTETGQIASRRVTASPAWRPMAGICLQTEGDTTFACGGHVEDRIALGDAVEVNADGSFLLHGRHTDLINIAGKRTSLAYLNQQLLAIDGIEDGSFFMPDEEHADELGDDHCAPITRLCAVVVAPALQPAQIRAALRERIDAVFLPRPLIFAAQLPRNATGKLTRASLAALIAQHRAETSPRAAAADTAQ